MIDLGASPVGQRFISGSCGRHPACWLFGPRQSQRFVDGVVGDDGAVGVPETFQVDV